MSTPAAPAPQTTLIAVDISGSVNQQAVYWNLVASVAEEYPPTDPANKYLLWDHGYQYVDAACVINAIKTRRGHGGTEPRCVAAAMRECAPQRLVLITDGEVSQQSVQMTDRVLNAYTEQHGALPDVCCHIVNYRPNLSVTAPFTRGNTAKVVTHVGSRAEVVFSLTRDDYRLLDQIDDMSYATFSEKYDTVHAALTALTMGASGAPAIHERLVRAKRRMTAEIAQADDGSAAKSVYRQLKVRPDVVQPTTEFLSHMVSEFYHGGEVTRFTERIDRLINLANNNIGANPFRADAFAASKIQSNAVNFAAAADDADTSVLKPADVDLDLSGATAAAAMQCPILVTEDIPVILVYEGAPVLCGTDKAGVDQIVRNPLAIVGMAELRSHLTARLGRTIGLSAFLHLAGQQTPSAQEDDADEEETANADANAARPVVRPFPCPFSRRTVVGCIPLGVRKNHLRVANAALYSVFTGGKAVGNVDLYFAAVWALSQPDRALSYNTEAIDALTHCMVWRMDNHTTYASLTGLPNMVVTRIPLGLAIWFVVVSGTLSGFPSPSVLPLRTHLFVVPHLLDLLAAAGLPVPPDALDVVRLTTNLFRHMRAIKA